MKFVARPLDIGVRFGMESWPGVLIVYLWRLTATGAERTDAALVEDFLADRRHLGGK